MVSTVVTNLFDLSQTVAPYLKSYVSFSMLGYLSALGVARLIKVQNPKVQIGQSLQFMHNVFLSLQSLGLMVMIYILYTDTVAMENSKLKADEQLHPIYNMLTILTQAPSRMESQYFEITMVVFLLSKLYETLDTIILILNDKPLLLLHVWHHTSTYTAFYTGLFTGAGFWIGMLNSFIHVIMYLYYAKVPGMKMIAKYITSLQIFHLFGGFVLNLYTMMFPMTNITYGGDKIDCTFFSILNAGFCFSYFFLFLAFFSKKYHKNGSIYTLLGVSKRTQKVVYDMQKRVMGEGVEKYIIAQGLCIPEDPIAKKA